MLRRWLLLGIALTFAPTLARADDDPAKYRGRSTPTRFEEALAWGPRILFFPFHLLAEFGIRRPIYAVSGWAEKAHVWPVVERILKPTPDFEWSPTFVLDLGVDTAAGARIVTRNLFVRDNELQARVSAGLNTLEFEAQDRWQSGPGFAGVRQYAAYRNRPFFGLGPDSPDRWSYFGQHRWEAWAFAGVDAGPHVRIQASEGFRREIVGSAGADPSIETVFDTRSLPGFAPLNLALFAADLNLDTRTDREGENGGVRVLANGTYARDVVVAERSFVTAELDAQAAVEVSKPDRVLSARFYGADSFPLGSEPVPLTHLSMLGWRNHLGFVWGRFRGESALMVEVRYRYPIAYFGDAQLAMSAGNVFARDFKDFDVAKLTTSFAVGLRTRRTGFVPIEMMVGFGTTRFDQPFSIDSVRLYFSTTEAL